MKKKKVIIYVMLMLTLLCTSVYATVSGTATLTASPSGTVCAGDEIDVTFTLSDIEADNGIDSIRLYIDIDEDVIDSITVDNFVTDDGTVAIGSNSLTVKESTSATAAIDTGIWLTSHSSEDDYDNDYVVIVNFSTPITTATDLFTITFNVSEDAAKGTYSDAIQYSTIYIYYGSSDRNTVSNQSLDVVVGTASSNNNANTNNSNNNANNASNNANNNANTNNASNNANKNTNNASNNANNAANNANTNNASNNANTNNASNNANNNANNNTNNANNNANTNNTSNNGTSGTTNNNSSNTNDTADTTTAVGTLPNTGYKLLLIPIVLAILTGLICYKKYNKYNNF